MSPEPDLPRARPVHIPGIEAGVTEGMIHDLVHAFYARVRRDDFLGPVFNAVVTDWDEHLARLCDFWSSVILMTGRYKGNPMRAHIALNALTQAHFDSWLKLFGETARATCPPAAMLFVDRAERIARSLMLGVHAHSLRTGVQECPVDKGVQACAE